LANLDMPAAPVKSALRKAWNAAEELPDFPVQATRQLAVEKYSTAKWNFKS